MFRYGRDHRSVVQDGIAANGPQRDKVLAVTRLYLAECSRYDFSRAVDKENVVAKALGGFHQMGRENDRLVLCFQFIQNLDHEFDVDRVEAGKRLVENKQVRIV